MLIPLSTYYVPENKEIQFLLTDGIKGYYLNTTVNEGLIEPDIKTEAVWLMMLFAFIGGLILNIMPCVLPVLSLKAMAIAGKTTIQSNKHWGYPIGILISFWLFAVVILILKSAGTAVGWGFHLQEPLVIAALSFLFVFIALMLWDLTPSGASLSGIGERLTQGNSFTSQFFTGVLAVVVASPCTAPFMATALGVAMVSPAIDTILIFTALALGFALPMTLLSISPKFASLLPKPGAWMETFKHFLAFPMLASTIWLVWIFLGQTDSLGQLWLLFGLLVFSLFIWLASKTSSSKYYLCLVVALSTAIYTSYQGANISVNTIEKTTNEHIFSEQKLSSLRNNNEIVLVNMTADWCITCKVNEQVALSDEKLKTFLAEQNIHYLVGDWTNKNQEILQYLTRYQRSGVPLYVVYGGNKSEQVLPQVLTPEIVIDAIKQAQKELNNAPSI